MPNESAGSEQPGIRNAPRRRQTAILKLCRCQSLKCQSRMPSGLSACICPLPNGIHGSSFQIYCHNVRAVTAALASLSVAEDVLGSQPM